MRKIGLLLVCLLVGLSGCSRPAPSNEADVEAIRVLMKGIWEKPESRLDITPISIEGDYAVAGWTQGEHGGRALLRKSDQAWKVVLCSGDALRDADFLQGAGLSAEAARSMVALVVEDESDIPKERVEQFDRFRGVVRMQ